MSNKTQHPASDMATSPVESTPPSVAAGSRASTVLRDDLQAGTLAPLQRHITVSPPGSTSPASDINRSLAQAQGHGQYLQTSTVGGFKPFQQLMETEITIEYGKNLKESRTIHQELLCCYSQKASSIFKKAKSLQEAYPVADGLRKQLKEHVPPYKSEKTFEAQHAENQAIPLMVRIYESYPLKSYRSTIQESVSEAIAEQVGKKNVIGPNTKTALQKKELKDMSIQTQLRGLTSKAVLAVAERLSSTLRDVKHTDRKTALTSRVTAAAQRRIILPDTEARVVRSLVHWAYGQGALTYEDAEHLYALRSLADFLGITELEQQCLKKLSSDSEDLIQLALSQNLTLCDLLGLGPEPAEGENEPAVPVNNIVQVVFQHVLRDTAAPKRLVSLVVNTLAKHLELGLWKQLKPLINPSMSIYLISALLVCRQVKNEEIHNPSIKSETGFTGDGDGNASFALNEQTWG